MKIRTGLFLFTLLAAIPMITVADDHAESATPKSKPAEMSTKESTSEGMKKLELEFPQPLFVGTPTNIMSDNLEEESTAPKELLIPEDVKLISLDTYVTSSDDAPIIGELEMITDGDKEGAEGSYVELGPGSQWVQIELDEESEIYAVVLWHFHSQARAYHDIVVQTADDEDMLENVKTIYNNDHDNSLGLGVGSDKEWIETYQGRLIDAKGTKAKYIRLYSDGNTSNPMNHYIEVEVYGKPVE